jgi:hypothetical protein
MFELITEGIIPADLDTVHVPSEEDMAWYLEATYVDPAERVW